MNILKSRKAAMFANVSDLSGVPIRDGRSLAQLSQPGTAWIGAPAGEVRVVGHRRVYRETVIVDDDLILIGVPTGESELVPMLTPAG